MSNLSEYMNPLQVRLVPELKLHKSAILLCFTFPVHTVKVTGCKSKRLACKMRDFSVSPASLGGVTLQTGYCPTTEVIKITS